MEDKPNLYPVLLQWDQGIEELKKLKNKVVKYFQSYSESHGGECDIYNSDCSRGYVIIYFKEQKAQQGVAQKSSHHLLLQDGSTLSLRVSLLDAENAQRMGDLLSLAASSDNGGPGPSADADHQPAYNPSAESRKRNNSDSDFTNGDRKRHEDDSNGRKEREMNRRGVGGAKERQQNMSSSGRRPSTDNDNYNSSEGSGTARNGSRGNSVRRQLSKEERRNNDPAYPPEDDGALGPSAGRGHQQANHQNPDIWKRSPSLTDPSSMDDQPKSLHDEPNELGERYKSRGYGAVDGKREVRKSPAGTDHDENRSQNSMTPGEEENLRPRRTEDSVKDRPAAPPEIFRSLTATLDKKWFTEDLQEEIKLKIPSLTIRNESDVVEVKGKFEEIKLLNDYLQREQELGAEKPPDTLSKGSPPDDNQVPGDNQADQLCLTSALYEYIVEIYRTDMDWLERSYGVKIDHRSAPEGSTYVRFIPQGSGSLPEDAKERFTDKVQKVTDDWSQETVDRSVVSLSFSDIKERVKAHWTKILVKREENMGIVLRGPRDELSQVMKFLEKADLEPARPRRAVTISTGNMRTENQVDPRHMDILKKLKQREISDIEKKYDVKMEERRINGSLVVTFRTMNAPPDLSPHASHSFITLLQKTFFNIKRKQINMKPVIQEERINLVQEELMKAGIDIVMECSKGTVLLIGHPVNVRFAEERLSGSQKPGRGPAGATAEEPMETDKSSSTAQKAEEPDTCPICQDEIEDKVILEKCKHAYCKACLRELMARKPVCAICGVAYGKVTGDQPDGTMNVSTYGRSLPGYPECGTIQIDYNIPGGFQKENHPHPGKHFSGAYRTAYLPDNKEGRDILQLLKKAFDQKLIFTVGDSRTSGATDIVTWNDIHHKTSTHGGPQGFGYPDPDYLNRVRDELKAKGIE